MTATLIYYSGRLLIIIMRPKASLTDCYTAAELRVDLGYIFNELGRIYKETGLTETGIQDSIDKFMFYANWGFLK